MKKTIKDMNFVIIEDEELAAKRLEGMIRSFNPGAKVLASLESVEGAVEWFRNNPEPDLIFLDDLENDDNVRDKGQRDKVQDFVLKAVLGLAGQQAMNDRVHSLLQLGIVAQSQRLNRRDQVLAHELAGPRDEVGRRLPVAEFKHFEQSGIRGGGANQPMAHVCVNLSADPAAAAKMHAGNRFQDGPSSRRLLRGKG